MRPFEPMLAPAEDPLTYPRYFQELKFPLRCSNKIDGIRGVTIDDAILSRKLIAHPNAYAQDRFAGINGLDGEICEGNITDWDLVHRTGGTLRSHYKTADLHFYVFDSIMPEDKEKSFEERLDIARDLIEMYDNPYVHLLEHKLCHNLEELLNAEAEALEAGFEGLMMRNPDGHYKYGRATWREGLIMKLKRFEEIEGVVVGVEEKMHNTNEDVRGNTGKAKRGFSQEGLVPAGTVGKFIVEVNGAIETVAPGAFNHAQLQRLWNNPSLYMGKTIRVRHTPHGALNGLRQARAAGFRDSYDL